MSGLLFLLDWAVDTVEETDVHPLDGCEAMFPHVPGGTIATGQERLPSHLVFRVRHRSQDAQRVIPFLGGLEQVALDLQLEHDIGSISFRRDAKQYPSQRRQSTYFSCVSIDRD